MGLTGFRQVNQKVKQFSSVVCSIYDFCIYLTQGRPATKGEMGDAGLAVLPGDVSYAISATVFTRYYSNIYN